MKQYLNLNLKGGARARLTILKNAAAYTNAPDVNLPPSRRFADWRAARESNLRTTHKSIWQGYNTKNAGTRYETKRPIWSGHAGEQFRGEAKVHEVSELHISHRGWYSDADNHATICGIVARLPHGRWMAGYYSSDNGERVYFANVFKTLEEAANEADDEARRVAEEEKEYSERYQEARVLDDEIEQLQTDVSELFPMRHHARARRELAAAVDKLRTMRARRADEFADVE